MFKIRKNEAGVSLVEVLVAIAIISIILVAVGFSVTAFVSAREKLLNDTKSLYLAEEGYEILRVIRDDDWNTLDALTREATYYLDVSTTTLAVSTTPEVIDGEFYRSFVLNVAYRNNNDDFVETGGTLPDAGTVHVEMSVFGPNGTTTLSALLTNLHAI